MTHADRDTHPTLTLIQGGRSSRFDVEAALARLLERLSSHNNPGLPLMSRTAADKAYEAHMDCDPLTCSTRVSAVIVIRDDYRWFRDRGM